MNALRRRAKLPARLRSAIQSGSSRRAVTSSAVGESEVLLEAAYQLVLGRPADPSGRDVFLPRIRQGDWTVVDLCTELVRSEEFAQRLSSQLRVDYEGDDLAQPVTDSSLEFIDVSALIQSTSVEALNETADRYFRRALDYPDVLLAKPVSNVVEAPELLITFGTLLRGLKPLPGFRVLDFGAGTCWTSRLLAQLGCHVVAMDVSAAALQIGRQSFERSPLFGVTYPPEFVVFDGHHFELADDSFDLVLCFDAFHHVPNPETVLAEMARVLVPGGLAGFSEPGPRHSLSGQSQFEMRSFGVLENNIVMDDIVGWSESAGFDDIRMAIFDASTFWCSLPEFEEFLGGQPSTLADHLRISHRNRRLFVLKKNGHREPDSRDGSLLHCELQLLDLTVERMDGHDSLVVTGLCRATNTGKARWLPSADAIGGVQLGARLNRQGEVTQDLGLSPIAGEGVPVGDGRDIPFRIEIAGGDVELSKSASLEFDLISQGVGWFAVYGSTPCIASLP
jgi:SAM-dependent methyltransferase